MEENKLRNEAEEQVEITVERKLVELYTLQQIDSKIPIADWSGTW